MAFAIAFELPRPLGLCVGVILPPPTERVSEAALARLLPAEAEHARSLKPRRAVSWVGGRLALRHGAEVLGVELPPVMSTPRGAPMMPKGLLGSVSHKDDMAVALLAADDGWHRGIDVEARDPPRPRIERLICTASERRGLPLEPERRWDQLLLRFALKEALYKALDPIVQRYVAFREVEVAGLLSGRVTFKLALDPPPGRPLMTSGEWERLDSGHVLARVRARRLP